MQPRRQPIVRLSREKGIELLTGALEGSQNGTEALRTAILAGPGESPRQADEDVARALFGDDE